MKMVGWRIKPNESVSHYYKEHNGERFDVISLCGKRRSNRGELVFPDPDRDGRQTCNLCLTEAKIDFDREIKTWLGI